MQVRKALLQDASNIYDLVNSLSGDGTLLKRPFAEVCENIRGGGTLKALIEEAEMHGVQSVCLFTRIPDFFFKYGFRIVEDKSELPDKIFKDCQSCPRLHRCDEVAMVRGRIPRMSILGPRQEAQELVRLSG
jgi:amino-acid N-acetyltransferase